MRKRRRTVWVGGVLAAILAALFLAACGGGSSSSSSATSEGNTSEVEGSSGSGKEATGEPLKLFQIYQQNSQLQYGYARTNGGTRAAIAAINEEGGVNGHPLELVTCDDNSEPNLATKCAREAVKEEPWAVVASTSLYTPTIGPILESAGIPYVGAWATEGWDMTAPGSFPVGGGVHTTFISLTHALTAAGAKKIAVVNLEVPVSLELTKEVVKYMPKLGGEPVGEVTVPPTAADMSSYVAAAKETGAEGVILAMTRAQDVGFIKAAKSLGAEFKIGLELGDVDPNEIADVADWADGRIVAAGPYPPAANPGESEGAVKFEEEEKAAAEQGIENVEQEGAAINGWAPVWALALLAEKHPEATESTEALVEVMKAEKEGVDVFELVDWKPGEEGPAAWPRMPVVNIWLAELKEGGYHLSQPKPIELNEELGFK